MMQSSTLMYESRHLVYFALLSSCSPLSRRCKTEAMNCVVSLFQIFKHLSAKDAASVLTAKALSTMTPDQIKSLPPEVLAALSDEQLAALQPEQLVGLSAQHLAALSPEQLLSVTGGLAGIQQWTCVSIVIWLCVFCFSASDVYLMWSVWRGAILSEKSCDNPHSVPLICR